MKTETVFTDERFKDVQIRWAEGCVFGFWRRGVVRAAEAYRGYSEEIGWVCEGSFMHNGVKGNPPTLEHAKQIAEYQFDQMADKPVPVHWKVAYRYRRGGRVCRNCAQFLPCDLGGQCLHPKISPNAARPEAVVAGYDCDLFDGHVL